MNQYPLLIEVRATKYDGSGLRTWTAQVLQHDGPLLILDASFDHEIKHHLLGTIASGTRSIEYYWLDRWYNVFRLAHENGQLRNYYCNINEPPVFDGKVLSYVDLDIDILVEPNLSYRIVDLEDFELNAARFSYPAEVRAGVQNGLDHLVKLIKAGSFPFNQE